MPRKIWTLIVLGLFSSGAIAFAEPLSEQETVILKKRLIPTPKQVAFRDGPEVVLDQSLTVNIELASDDNEAKAKTATIFKRYFNAEPNIAVAKKDDAPKDTEAYRIRAAGKVVTLSAADFRGIRYALSSLRQLAESNRGTATVVDYRIPETEIDDAPAMPFRGLHVCWFPETTPVRIEQALRLAAYYKFNYLVLEFWGTYLYKSHPELCWQEFKTSPENVQRLVAIGKDLGVTMIPQFNLFGHAAACRESSGKHAVLDLHPQYLPQFEPDGWTWCLSNPEARKTISDIVLELYEIFDKPPYFHIGCDEADNLAECRSCRRADYKALFKDHLLFFYKLLAERNCRTMMWHDMLIDKSDLRWNGYIAMGNAKTDGLLGQLPKDIVICDWQYGGPRADEKWPTMRFFKEQGFAVLACPWENAPGIRSQAKAVPENGLDGLLYTTWHHMDGSNMFRMFSVGAQATWRAADAPGIERSIFAMHLRQIGWDIPLEKYRDTGRVDWQVAPEKFLDDSLPGW
jgi:hypothetical protein